MKINEVMAQEPSSPADGPNNQSELYALESKLHEELTRNTNLYSQQFKSFSLLRRIRKENDALLDAIELISPTIIDGAPPVDPKTDSEKVEYKTDAVDWNELFTALYS